ncbi:MAG: undecaprenyl-diphosphate phosphatase [Acidobacteriota bacterium]
MSPLQAFILALVQGITEFLPISSSAHLILMPHLMGWHDQGLVFDVLTNAGTLLAVLVYFRRDLAELVPQALEPHRWRDDDGAVRLLPALVVGTIPVVIAGSTFYRWIATDARSPALIGVTSILFGLLLWWADRRGKGERSLAGLTWRDVWIVGVAEAFALIPGTSRSGITITAALLLGFRRAEAARFSFLLAIPVSLAALAMDLRELAAEGPGEGGWLPLGIGFGVSAVSAYLVIGWLLDWIRRQDLTLFVVYRVLLGLVILGLAWMT